MFSSVNLSDTTPSRISCPAWSTVTRNTAHGEKLRRVRPLYSCGNFNKWRLTSLRFLDESVYDSSHSLEQSEIAGRGGAIMASNGFDLPIRQEVGLMPTVAEIQRQEMAGVEPGSDSPISQEQPITQGMDMPADRRRISTALRSVGQSTLNAQSDSSHASLFDCAGGSAAVSQLMGGGAAMPPP